MNSIDLLSNNVQKVAYNIGIKTLRPIQEEAIGCILGTDLDLLISAGTASGKTEACFLPILSALEDSLKGAFQVLYIAPLNALINDQNKRLWRLCNPLQIQVQRWHGDVSLSEKQKFINNPKGILQITPESLESIFVNKTAALPFLFKDITFVIIDEIHTFIDSRRGLQLISLLHRLKSYTPQLLRIVGLSATIADPAPYKKWINPQHPDHVQLIQSTQNSKEIRYALYAFINEAQTDTPDELINDIYYLCQDKRNLIFCNQRALTENLSVRLNALAELRHHSKQHFFVHHSSISKEQKEFVEKKLMDPTAFNSTLCTSTLELGIDLGDLDYILQIDDTPSVSAFKQRLGRSGRKDGEPQVIQMYATYPEGLLYSVAIMEAAKANQLENPALPKVPFDIVFHQLLSLSVEKSPFNLHNLLDIVEDNPIFAEIDQEDLFTLLEDMFAKDYLKLMPQEDIILGLNGEKILRNYHFYSVFFTPIQYEVICANNSLKIGTLTRPTYLAEGACIILAGRRWQITKIDDRLKKLYVGSANKGKASFLGNGYDRNDLISHKAYEILLAEDDYPYLNPDAKTILQNMRLIYRQHPCTINQRFIFPQDSGCCFDTFAGDAIVRTLCKMLGNLGYNVTKTDPLGRIHLDRRIEPDLRQVLIERDYPNFFTPQEIAESHIQKYYDYLPLQLKEKMLEEEYINVPKAKDFLKGIRFIKLL